MRTSSLAAALGAALLALPATAIADPGHGRGHDRSAADTAPAANEQPTARPQQHRKPGVQFVLRGSFTADGTLHVTSGNAHTRRGGFIGQDVALDLSSARFSVADANGDGKADAGDVLAGDVVIVKVRLPRGTAYEAPAEGETAAALRVRQLVDVTRRTTED